MIAAKRLKTTKGLENRIYMEQERLIQKKFGVKAAKVANYGHGVEGVDSYVHVSTKVYGHGVLNSSGWLGKGIEHKFF